jgi:hypothetical protein
MAAGPAGGGQVLDEDVEVLEVVLPEPRQRVEQAVLVEPVEALETRVAAPADLGGPLPVVPHVEVAALRVDLVGVDRGGERAALGVSEGVAQVAGVAEGRADVLPALAADDRLLTLGLIAFLLPPLRLLPLVAALPLRAGRQAAALLDRRRVGLGRGDGHRLAEEAELGAHPGGPGAHWASLPYS